MNWLATHWPNLVLLALIIPVLVYAAMDTMKLHKKNKARYDLVEEDR